MTQKVRETVEYNLYYEEDDAMEYPEWEADLSEVVYFYNSLGENPTQAAAYAQARLVQRTRTVFVSDWELVEE